MPSPRCGGRRCARPFRRSKSCRLAVAIMMQIVAELADPGEAGLQHLDIDHGRDCFDVVRRHRQARTDIASRHVQKLSAVGPARLGEAGHSTLEGMAVKVRHARGWRGRNDQSLGCGGTSVAIGADFARIDDEAHIAAPPFRRQRVSCVHSNAFAAACPPLRLCIYIIAGQEANRDGRSWRQQPADRRVWIWRNARLGDACGRQAGPQTIERGAHRRARTAVSFTPDRKSEAPSARRWTAAEGDRLRGALDHAGPCRLPLASRLCRRSRAGIRPAPRQRLLRRDRAGPAAGSFLR